MYDIIVIGGGPAGMTAALYALRSKKSVLVIEKCGFGGQIAYSPKVENYPGFRSVSGSELADHMLEQIMSHGADVELETVTAIEDEGAVKRVVTEEGTEYECRAVIISTGVKHRMLGLEGEHELVGRGISFCAVCDGDFYTGQTVAVAGGGNSALQEAILLSESCKKVIIVQNLDYFTGEESLRDALLARPNVRAVTGTVIEQLLTENGELCGLKLYCKATDEHSELSCDGLFVAVGLIPENDIFSGLASLDPNGYIDADEYCLTKTPGVFVAGDCRAKQIRQLTTAAADGSIAALAACKYADSVKQP